MALATTEMLLFVVSVYAAAVIRFWGQGLGFVYQQVGFANASIFALIMSICMLSMGLCRRSYIADLNGMPSVLPRVAISHVIGLLVLAAMFYIFPDLHVYRGVSIGAVIIAFFGSLTIRALFIEFTDHRIFKHRVLVCGVDKNAQIIEALAYFKAGRLMFNVVYYVRCGQQRIEED